MSDYRYSGVDEATFNAFQEELAALYDTYAEQAKTLDRTGMMDQWYIAEGGDGEEFNITGPVAEQMRQDRMALQSLGDQYNQAFFDLANQYGVNTVHERNDKIYYLTPGDPIGMTLGTDPWAALGGEITSNEVGGWSRDRRTDSADFGDYFKALAPAVLGLASGNPFYALAAKGVTTGGDIAIEDVAIAFVSHYLGGAGESTKSADQLGEMSEALEHATDVLANPGNYPADAVDWARNITVINNVSERIGELMPVLEASGSVLDGVGAVQDMLDVGEDEAQKIYETLHSEVDKIGTISSDVMGDVDLTVPTINLPPPEEVEEEVVEDEGQGGEPDSGGGGDDASAMPDAAGGELGGSEDPDWVYQGGGVWKSSNSSETIIGPEDPNARDVTDEEMGVLWETGKYRWGDDLEGAGDSSPTDDTTVSGNDSVDVDGDGIPDLVWNPDREKWEEVAENGAEESTAEESTAEEGNDGTGALVTGGVLGGLGTGSSGQSGSGSNGDGGSGDGGDGNGDGDGGDGEGGSGSQGFGIGFPFNQAPQSDRPEVEAFKPAGTDAGYPRKLGAYVSSLVDNKPVIQPHAQQGDTSRKELEDLFDLIMSQNNSPNEEYRSSQERFLADLLGL